MEKTADPALVALEGRNDKAIRRAYVDKSQEETNARRAAQRKNKPKNTKKTEVDNSHTETYGEESLSSYRAHYPKALGNTKSTRDAQKQRETN